MAEEKTLQTTDPKAHGSIKALINSDQFRSAVRASLPSHLKPNRFVRVALTALTRTPKLAECDQASFFQALLTLSQLGLEPDGRNAHLIPFENRKRGVTEVQLIVDYKGLVDLALRSGSISYIHADKVCDNDVFDYDKGAIKTHKVDFKKPRGNAYAYYAIARFKDGTEKCEVMTRDEVGEIRQRSRAKDSGPWVTDFDQMANKTVFRRLSKWLQLSPEYRDALEADADSLEERRFDQAIPIAKPVFDLPAGKPTENDEAEKPSKKTKLTPKKKKGGALGPNALEIKKRVEAAKYTTDDFIKVAVNNEWLESPPPPFEQIDEEKMAVFIENFDEVAKQMDLANAPKPEPKDALFS